MQHESKKIALIINELVTMLLLKGKGNIEVKINRDELSTEFIIVQHECDYDMDYIKNLSYNLNTQRQAEVEGYYWQLVGDDDSFDELPLVGAMIDDAEVDYKEGLLTIKIIRRYYNR